MLYGFLREGDHERGSRINILYLRTVGLLAASRARFASDADADQDRLQQQINHHAVTYRFIETR